MVYVEYLRVRGALKWIAIVLGVLLLISVVIRLAVVAFEHNAMGQITEMRKDPGTTIVESTTPDGAHRTVIDDPKKQAHVTIDDYGWGHKHIQILDRSPGDREKENVVAGSVHVRTLPSGDGTVTDIDTNGVQPFRSFLFGGIAMALILATILGAPFARENDGHLELAFTKPIDRLTLGLKTIGTDVGGIVAALVLGTLFALVANTLFEIPHLTFGLEDALALVLGTLAPIAWYAMLNAATASIKRGHFAVIAFAWPIALLVFGLTFIPPNANAVLAVVHWTAAVLATIDPISYMHFSIVPVEIDGQQVLSFSATKQILAMAALAVGYSALALVQWRRVEG